MKFSRSYVGSIYSRACKLAVSCFVMSDSSSDGDGRSGGGSGGSMSDSDDFDAPALAPTKVRRSRFTFRRSGH